MSTRNSTSRTRQFERALLDSAANDRPPAHSEAKLMAGLVAAGVALPKLATAQTAATTAVLKAAATTPHQVASLTTAAWLKWIGAGVLAGSLTVGARVIAERPTSAPTQAPIAVGSVGAAPAVLSPPAPGEIQPDHAPAKTVEPLVGQGRFSKTTAPPAVLAGVPQAQMQTAQEPPPAPPEPAPTAEATASPRASADLQHLGEQVMLLDRARQALQAGDARAAAGWIERYRQQFPQGVLGPEADRLWNQAHQSPSP